MYFELYLHSVLHGSQMARTDSSDMVPLESSTCSVSTKTITELSQATPQHTTVSPKRISPPPPSAPVSSTSGFSTQQQYPLEPDTISTDSSSLDDEHKRRRRKLPFSFGKKKNKPVK